MYLIIGASSFIGRHLYEYCKSNQIDVLGTYYMHPVYEEWVQFDLCKDTISSICDKYTGGQLPEAVIICGANTSIDNCKSNEEKSSQLNVGGTIRILDEIKSQEIKSVFLSSEAVFDGKRGMYEENDTPNPVTVYGKQKLLMEEYIVRNLENYVILRISRAVGCTFGEKDIFHEFYQNIVNNQEIICLKNQSFCPTNVNDIVQVIMKVVKMGVKGLYHLSNSNLVSRYQLAKLYSKAVFGDEYERIREMEYDELPFIDNRHIRAGLRGDKLADLLCFRYMDIEEILQKYKVTLPAFEL